MTLTLFLSFYGCQEPADSLEWANHVQETETAHSGLQDLTWGCPEEEPQVRSWWDFEDEIGVSVLGVPTSVEVVVRYADGTATSVFISMIERDERPGSAMWSIWSGTVEDEGNQAVTAWVYLEERTVCSVAGPAARTTPPASSCLCVVQVQD